MPARLTPIIVPRAPREWISSTAATTTRYRFRANGSGSEALEPHDERNAALAVKGWGLLRDCFVLGRLTIAWTCSTIQSAIAVCYGKGGKRREVGRDRQGLKPRRTAAVSDELGHDDLAITSAYVRGNDNTEIIQAVRERPAPMIPATARLNAQRVPGCGPQQHRS